MGTLARRDGFDEVHVPGEPERRSRIERAGGVDVAETTWVRLFSRVVSLRMNVSRARNVHRVAQPCRTTDVSRCVAEPAPRQRAVGSQVRKACAVTVEGPQFGPVLYGTRGEIVVATLGSLSQASRRTLRGAATRGDTARRRSQMSERMRFGIFMAPFHPLARTRRC